MPRLFPRLRALIAACPALIAMGGAAAAVEPPPLVVAGGLAGRRAWQVGAIADERHVLVCGGTDEGGRPVSTCELFDESTGTSAPAPSMTKPRYAHSMARLNDGRILAVGGSSDGGALTPTAEIMDPATGRWRATTSLGGTLVRQQLLALRDGGALLVGDRDHNLTCARPAVWDPHSERWRELAINPPTFCPEHVVELPDGRVLLAGSDRTVVDGRRQGDAGLTTWTPRAPGNDTVRPLDPGSSLSTVLALAVGPTGRVLVVLTGLGSTRAALLDAELKIVSRAAIEIPRQAFLLADDRALLIGEKQAWTWHPNGQAGTDWKSPIELGEGLVAGSGQVLVFGAGPVVLGTGPPVDTVAQPCGLIVPFYARWAESLWRPALPPAVPGQLLTDACRQAVGGPADDGLGATLVAEIAGSDRADLGDRDRRFTLALATLAAIGTPWARTPLESALETGRGAADTRGAALAAFAEAGGDPAVTARVLSRWAQRAKEVDACVDNAILVALGKSPRVRAAGAEVLATVHEGKRCGFDSVRSYVCDPATVLPPDVAQACARAPAGEENRWRKRDERAGHLTVFAIETALAGAAATGAVVWRHEDASRILPVGLAAAAGFSLGYTATVTGACDGPMCGLKYVLGVGLGVLGGLAGGGIGLLATGESDGRTAIAVSSAALTILLAAVRLADAW
jgi:hypothetical protein